MSFTRQLCRCGMYFIFLKTKKGKAMPVDIETTSPEDDESTLFDIRRHRSHYVSCPYGNEFRKGKN